MLFTYNKFINEKKIIKSGIANFIYSKNFYDVLKIIKMDTTSNIANDIILSYGNINSKYTYIDITNKDDKISFIYDIDAVNIDKKKEDIWNHKNRKTIKIGKLINKVFKNKYNEFDLYKFINLYKSVIRQNKTYFKIFKGNNIRKWYNEDNIINIGTLGNSCMRYKRCQDYLDIYTNNPKKISLLVLFEKNNKKIIGRSLIWELEDGRKMMDRIYNSYDSDKYIFKRYANKNNININKHDDNINGISNVYTVLKPINYKLYPYLDTFFLYQPENGIITDTIKYCDLNKDIYILDDIYGTKRLYYKKNTYLHD